MGSKNNEPSIRFIGFNDNWEQRKLGEVVTIKSGMSPSAFELGDELYVKVDDLNYSFREQNDTQMKVTENLRCSKVKKGSIVFPKRGAAIMTNKVRIMGISGYMDTNMMALEPVEICTEFLYLFISKTGLYKIADTSTIPQINNKHIEPYEIIMPNVDEQMQIGTFFCNLDNLISLHQRKCDNLEIFKKTLLYKLFPKNKETKPLYRFNGFLDDWEQRKLGDMGDTFTGLSGKTKEDFGKGEAEFITYLNVFNNPISNIKLTERVELDKKQNEVRYGDIFFTTSSETPGEVGMSSVWLDNRENVYLNSFCFGYRLKDKVDPFYMAYSLRSNPIRNQFILLAQGISRYNISKTKAMDIEIMLPKLDEQIKLGNIFKEIDNLITLHKRKLENLDNLKKYFLNNMFI